MPESPAFIGTDFLVRVNTGTEAVPVWTVVGSQRDATVSRSLDTIDVSNKDSRNRRVKPGRYSVEITFDHLYVPGAAELQALKNAMLNATWTQIQEFVKGVAGKIYGGYVTGHEESFPDMGEAVVSCTFTGDGPETNPA
ncbi:MAG TPA: phage tail tube protein [Acidimicrobiales bacterium]|nr:phage tail tube protein [Acidimicrobiales bacterium]